MLAIEELGMDAVTEVESEWMVIYWLNWRGAG